MLNQKSFLFMVLMISMINVNAQYTLDELDKKPCFIGSSAFMLMNLDSSDRPDFYQLNLGYRISPKDAISLEVKTWKYSKSLGSMNRKSRNGVTKKFPGFVREKGFAIAYQRFLWKGLYTAVHVMSAWQSFNDINSKKIDDGFQIFNTYRLGYHIKLFKGRFFIEPSIAITHRPYHTKMPESFQRVDKQWSKFVYGEPGLHFGFNF